MGTCADSSDLSDAHRLVRRPASQSRSSAESLQCFQHKIAARDTERTISWEVGATRPVGRPRVGPGSRLSAMNLSDSRRGRESDHRAVCSCPGTQNWRKSQF
jgi:hypothetical protein